PFPHVAEHLPAAERAVACWERRDVDRRREGEIEIGVPMVRRCLAPWPAALAVGKARAARYGLADRRRLPFRLGRQAAPRPAAPGLRLVPIDERDGRVGGQLLSFGMAAPCPPAVVLGQPIDRALGACALAPGPARLGPKLARAISAGFDEGRELGVRDRRLGE